MFRYFHALSCGKRVESVLTVMQPRKYSNLNLLLCLAAIWFIVAPGRTLASCDMPSDKADSSRHDCCVRKSACDCELPFQDPEHRTTRSIRCRTDCPCTVAPDPASPTPRIAPLRLLIVEVLPVRAGTSFTPRPEGSPRGSTPAPFAAQRFVPPSPPRAPPF